MPQRKRIHARLMVAIPFRTGQDREKFLSWCDEQPGKTIGEIVLELIQSEIAQVEAIRKITGKRR